MRTFLSNCFYRLCMARKYSDMIPKVGDLDALTRHCMTLGQRHPNKRSVHCRRTQNQGFLQPPASDPFLPLPSPPSSSALREHAWPSRHHHTQRQGQLPSTLGPARALRHLSSPQMLPITLRGWSWPAGWTKYQSKATGCCRRSTAAGQSWPRPSRWRLLAWPTGL